MIKFLRSYYWKLRIKLQDLQNSMRSRKAVFENIYATDGWGNKESKSGSGSTLASTQKIIGYLPLVFEQYAIKTFLDIPCGDFNWMKEVAFGEVHYVGADIVDGLIEEDNKRYASPTRSFVVADLAADVLPKADLIFCRDCLVHLSYEDIYKALQNIRNSGATYLLTTTFSDHNNIDIVTGNWRPVNLQGPPFNLPEPIEIMEEDCSESEGQYNDKALALWYVKDLLL